MAELQEITGIGPATAARLADHGLTSVKRLAKADLDTIAAVPGFGPVRATAVRDAARAALPAPAEASTPKSDKRKAAKPKAAKPKASKAKGRDKAKAAKGAKATAAGTPQKAKKPGKSKRTEKTGKGKKKAKKR